MRLSYESLQKQQEVYRQAGIHIPAYSVEEVRSRTVEHPTWLHFGAGNIFRAFMARLQQRLLEQGEAESGIVVVDAFDEELIDRLYRPLECLSILVTLKGDGSFDKEVIASVAEALKPSTDLDILRRIFRDPGLQMVSMTITEKGYALQDLEGNYLPGIRADLEEGPSGAHTMMGLLTALLLHRYQNGAAPIAVVSMDNCSHNGEKLSQAVWTIAREWYERGKVSQDFLTYLQDDTQVAFPWTMIDKITPRPAQAVERELEALGLEGMEPLTTQKHTYAAAFVNAEAPEYLVIEDAFPNGRPALEKVGVYFTDRDTVNDTERMKVTTCLNPLHTALAVYGCLLGYATIAEEMQDPELVRLVRGIGEKEGLKVLKHPGILDPKCFLEEVLTERLPNPYMPDTPQRIATDTSQKIPVRYGETLKAYAPDLSELHYIPLAIAGWFRYLLGKDDQLEPMEVSPDPMLVSLTEALRGVSAGAPESYQGQLKPILQNEHLFGINLVDTCLGERIEGYFVRMLEGAGAVRRLLQSVA